MSLFESGGQGESSKQMCKPDPEDMIAQAHKRKEDFQRAIELLNELDDLPIGIVRGRDFESFILQLYGSFYASIRGCDKEIQRWLTDIDKGE